MGWVEGGRRAGAHTAAVDVETAQVFASLLALIAGRGAVLLLIGRAVAARSAASGVSVDAMTAPACGWPSSSPQRRPPAASTSPRSRLRACRLCWSSASPCTRSRSSCSWRPSGATAASAGTSCPSPSSVASCRRTTTSPNGDRRWTAGVRRRAVVRRRVVPELGFVSLAFMASAGSSPSWSGRAEGPARRPRSPGGIVTTRSRTPLVIVAVIIVAAVAGLLAVVLTHDSDDDGTVTAARPRRRPMRTRRATSRPMTPWSTAPSRSLATRCRVHARARRSAIGMTPPVITGTSYAGEPVEVVPGESGRRWSCSWPTRARTATPRSRAQRVARFGRRASRPRDHRGQHRCRGPAAELTPASGCRTAAGPGRRWPTTRRDQPSGPPAARATLFVVLGADGTVKAHAVGELPVDQLDALVDAALILSPSAQSTPAGGTSRWSGPCSPRRTPRSGRSHAGTSGRR